jgi:ribosomal protein S18 acetylase RimI-like enzyme
MAVRVRRAVLQDAIAIAHVHIDTWRSTYHGIVPDEVLSNMSYERGQRIWEATFLDPSKSTSVFVAEDDQSNVVGFAACGPARGDERVFSGELYAIYVIQRMQGKSVGRRLVLSAAHDLTARGLDSMLVWVLAKNPFNRFYESLGGEQVLTKDIVIGGKALKELRYGWKNLDSLIARLEKMTRINC